MTISELLESHRSIRKFQNKKVDERLMTKIFASAQIVASSSFLQGVTIIRVTDKQKRLAFREITGDQKYVEQAPEFFVFCADISRSMRCCLAHGNTPAQGLTEQFIIATVDTALYAQNVAIASEAQGLGVCYIGAIRNDPVRSTKLLELPQHVYPVFGMCVGWPDQDPEVKPRLPLSLILKENVYSYKGEKEALQSYDEQIADYYATRSQNQKTQGWSEQMAGLLNREARPHMLSFLQSQGFLKR